MRFGKTHIFYAEGLTVEVAQVDEVVIHIVAF